MRRRLVVLLAVISASAAAAAAAGQEPPPTTPPPPHPPPANPCLRPELRLRCPDLTMRPPHGLHLIRTPRGRALLASTNAIVNVGAGPLEIRGLRATQRTMRARQVIRAEPGSRARVLRGAGTIEFYDTRTHGVYWKFQRAARFELFRTDATGAPTTRVRTGPKLDYCFRDLRRLRRQDTRTPFARSPHRPAFGACSQYAFQRRVTLGTSVGWADIYPWSYAQNWIDVSGLRGCFRYVHTVDPDDRFRELREDNNSAGVTVRLPWRGRGHRGCR